MAVSGPNAAYDEETARSRYLGEEGTPRIERAQIRQAIRKDPRILNLLLNLAADEMVPQLMELYQKDQTPSPEALARATPALQEAFAQSQRPGDPGFSPNAQIATDPQPMGSPPTGARQPRKRGRAQGEGGLPTGPRQQETSLAP